MTPLPCEEKDGRPLDQRLQVSARTGWKRRAPTPRGTEEQEHTRAACPPGASFPGRLPAARAEKIGGTGARHAGRTTPGRATHNPNRTLRRPQGPGALRTPLRPPVPAGPRGAAPTPYLLHCPRARHPGLPHGVARLPAQHRELLSVHLHFERVGVGLRAAALRPRRGPGALPARRRWPGLSHGAPTSSQLHSASRSARFLQKRVRTPGSRPVLVPREPSRRELHATSKLAYAPTGERLQLPGGHALPTHRLLPARGPLGAVVHRAAPRRSRLRVRRRGERSGSLFWEAVGGSRPPCE